MLRHSLIILCLSLMLWGCKDELDIEEPVAPSTPWQEDDRFLFDIKVQFNTHADGERIHFMGRNHFSTIELMDDDTIEYVQHAFQWLEYQQSAQMPITDELFITANLNTVRIASTRDPVLQGASQFLQLKEIDPEFSFIQFAPFWRGEAIGVNDDNVCLIAYQYETVDGEFGLRALKVRVTFNDSFMEIDEMSMIDIPDSGFGIRSILPVGDDFLISTGRSNYYLDENNQLEEVLAQSLNNLFQVDNEWIGTTTRSVYRSSDGLTWTEGGTPDRILDLISFDKMGDHTIGIYNSQIFLFDIEGDNLQITELDNEGLFGHEITSVDTFNDRVYVATLSGVFVKDLEDFWKERVREEG